MKAHVDLRDHRNDDLIWKAMGVADGFAVASKSAYSLAPPQLNEYLLHCKLVSEVAVAIGKVGACWVNMDNADRDVRRITAFLPIARDGIRVLAQKCDTRWVVIRQEAGVAGGVLVRRAKDETSSDMGCIAAVGAIL